MVVAVFPVILAALVMAMLAFAAAQLFRPLLVAVFSRAPVIGGWIQSQIDVLLIGLVVIVGNQIEAGIGELRTLISAAFNDVWGHRVWTGYAFDHAWAALYQVANVLLPVKLLEQAAYTTRVWITSAAHTDEVWKAATDYTTQVWRIEAQHADQVWADSTAYTTAVWKAEGAHADFVWQQATQHTDQVVHELAAHVDYVWKTTAGYAESLVGIEMRRALDAEHALQAELAAVGAGTIGTVESLWRQETARAQGAEAGIAAAGVAAVAAVAARVAEIEDSPCQQRCGVLGDLGGLLQGLEDAAFLDAVLALAATSARDPGAAAGEMQGLAGMVGDMLQLVHGVVGV